MYKIGIIIYKFIFGSVKTSRGKETLESFQTNKKRTQESKYNVRRIMNTTQKSNKQ